MKNRNRSICVVILYLIMHALFLNPNVYASSNLGVKTQFIIKVWSEGIENFYQTEKHYPNMNTGIKIIKGLEGNPGDSWGNELIYIYPAKYGDKKFDLYSKGRNGIDEYGEGDDISNWKEFNKIYISFWPNYLIAAIIVLIIIAVIFFFKKTHKSQGHS